VEFKAFTLALLSALAKDVSPAVLIPVHTTGLLDSRHCTRRLNISMVARSVPSVSLRLRLFLLTVKVASWESREREPSVKE